MRSGSTRGQGRGMSETYCLDVSGKGILTISENLHKISNTVQRISVFGCGDMTPPDGAWMTRDGDVIEIGCHSGWKTWRLECRENQWMGSVGFCGRRNENLPKDLEQDKRKDEENEQKQTQVLNVSPGTNSCLVYFY